MAAPVGVCPPPPATYTERHPSRRSFRVDLCRHRRSGSADFESEQRLELFARMPRGEPDKHEVVVDAVNAGVVGHDAVDHARPAPRQTARRHEHARTEKTGGRKESTSTGTFWRST